MSIPNFSNPPVPTIGVGQLAFGSSSQTLTSDVNGQYSAATGFVTSNGFTATNDFVSANAIAGDIGYNSSAKAYYVCNASGSGQIRNIINSEIVDGTTITAAAETALYSSAALLPANSIYPGRVIRFEYFGILSTAIAAPGTLTFKVKLGSVVIATVTSPTLVTSLASNAFNLSGRIVCRTVGASGTFEGFADFTVYSETTGLPIITDRGLGHNIVVDTTSAMDLSVTSTFSATGNSITARSRIVEV